MDHLANWALSAISIMDLAIGRLAWQFFASIWNDVGRIAVRAELDASFPYKMEKNNR